MKLGASVCMATFDTFTFIFCRRSCNSVAHALVQNGYRMATAIMFWLGSSSDFVSALVASESARHVD